ncbi:MAG: hypothetical protein JWO72_912, partial [Caulobacteraceae bacterium]|nr:hypothetical protein [Caulobacteraceae bacterium]
MRLARNQACEAGVALRDPVLMSSASKTAPRTTKSRATNEMVEVGKTVLY